ncbi:hypothetical protein AVEN_194863-1 [Araneus ventricosus]|uniref:Secreted protein n=1 Tax=Araneus ventricosus TaxID=182803 RepID=A0A4Y2B3P3_ARAVE|nr:hypothetical protein AVEN_194863-1 [Araneus ventricosus]
MCHHIAQCHPICVIIICVILCVSHPMCHVIPYVSSSHVSCHPICVIIICVISSHMCHHHMCHVVPCVSKYVFSKILGPFDLFYHLVELKRFKTGHIQAGFSNFRLQS